MINVLIGAGGHSKVVYEIARKIDIVFDSFVDPNVENFLDLKKLNENDSIDSYFLGIGGITPKQLERRQEIYTRHKKAGCYPLSIVSALSHVSVSSLIGSGTLIANNVTVQPGAKIGENVILNTGSIIEHDAIIEDGAHIAPGAIILGGSVVGSCAMVGSGAVVLPGQTVPSSFLVPSLTRYRNEN